MSRRADIVHALRDNPIALAPRMGFTLLTDMHADWVREMVFGTEDWTLQGHRGSYKTTCVSFSLWEQMLLMPNMQVAFFRKTDKDTQEIIEQVAKMLRSDATQYLAESLWGVGCDITTENSLELSTSLTNDPRGGAQLTGMGIGGSLTGKHYDRIYTDDIVNLKDRTSRAERERTRDAYREMSANLLNRGGKIINTGTPWHLNDAFELMPEPVRFDCYATGLMTPEQIEEKRASTTPSLFAANYELRHIPSDDVIFTNPRTGASHERVYNGTCHVDAAYGGEDFTAFTAMRYDSGTFYVYGRLWRSHVSDVAEQIRADHERLMLGRMHMETNADKGYAAREFKALGIPVTTYFETTNKAIKIETFGKQVWPMVEFVAGTDEEYINQVCDWTEDADHDDAPDSLASLARIMIPKSTRRKHRGVLY